MPKTCALEILRHWSSGLRQSSGSAFYSESEWKADPELLNYNFDVI